MDYLLSFDGNQFEHLMAEYLEARAYRDVQRVGGSGDLGVDIVCRDRAGSLVAVQCKRFAPERKVGAPAIQVFFGMVVRRKAERGLFITTSTYTAPARKLAAELDIELIDGETLAQYYLVKEDRERKEREERDRLQRAEHERIARERRAELERIRRQSRADQAHWDKLDRQRRAQEELGQQQIPTQPPASPSSSQVLQQKTDSDRGPTVQTPSPPTCTQPTRSSPSIGTHSDSSQPRNHGEIRRYVFWAIVIVIVLMIVLVGQT